MAQPTSIPTPSQDRAANLWTVPRVGRPPVDRRSRDLGFPATLVDMTDSPLTPTISTQADLQDAWRKLMGPWGFGGHSIWMMLILDDRPLPQLTEITDAEEPPDTELVAGLVEVLQRLDRELAPGARFAFLRSRPGVDAITGVDRAWASTLYDAARRAAVPCEVVHLATRGAVRPVPQDDIGVAATSA